MLQIFTPVQAIALTGRQCGVLAAAGNFSWRDPESLTDPNYLLLSKVLWSTKIESRPKSATSSLPESIQTPLMPVPWLQIASIDPLQ